MQKSKGLSKAERALLRDARCCALHAAARCCAMQAAGQRAVTADNASRELAAAER
jgi:hypothetical protein